MTNPEPAYEFDCCECGRHIVVLSGPKPDPPLCAACLMLPGWPRDKKLSAVIDPGRRAPGEPWEG